MAKTEKKRRCSATTKAGKRCRNVAMHGHLVCIAHAERKVKDDRGFGGAQPGSGRPRNARPTDVQRQLVEENVAIVQRPYWRTLGYDLVVEDDGVRLAEIANGGAKVFGRDGEGGVHLSDVEDLGAQVAAAEALQNRAFGKPRQVAELTGGDGGPVRIREEAFADPQVRRMLGDIVKHFGADRSG